MGSDTAILVVISDLHLNSTVALCPPAVALDDGGTYRPSKIQRQLWRWWLDSWEQVKATVEREKAELYVVVNGDVVEGYHHRWTQLISSNPADQERMAITVLDPVAQMADHLFFVRGTQAHAGRSAHWEETLADDLGAESDTETGTASWWHLKFKLGGVKFSIAHHRPIAKLPWTMGGPANRLAAHIVYKYAKRGWKRPDVVVRSHGHKIDDSSKTHPVKVICAPAWQSSTEFINKIDPDSFADVGSLLFVCRDGRYDWRWIGENQYLWAEPKLWRKKS